MANSERRLSSDKSKKKDTRPMCPNYGYRGHTADKRYKLYGYPPAIDLQTITLFINKGRTTQSKMEMRK